MKLAAFQSAQLDAEKVKLRKQVQELQAQLQKILLEKDQISKGFDFQKDVMSAKLVVPPWHPLSKKPSKGKAVVSAFLSDTHYDEWIDAAQVAFMNEYNRKIAEKRTQNFFDNVVTLSKHYLSGMAYDGLVLSLGGDILSGAIHEELVETNEAPILESVLHWTEQLISGIEFISQHFNHVQIPCVVGNHGRRSKKPRSKGRVQDNFDWLIYMMIQRHFKGNDKISFLISPSADQRFQIYDTRFLLTHGDQFRGGSGIAGLMSPLLIGDSRKRKRDAAAGQGYDRLLLGHWHELAMFKDVMVNGSVKGYDEYAYVSNFAFTPPQQMFWINSPNHGVTISAPIHVASNDEKYPMK